MMADATIDKVVYFVRHGQSEDNVAPVFQSPHSPLSEVGRTQAQRIAARVAKLAFDALLTSPYQRAKETAEAIGKVTGKAPEFCALFTERVKPTSVNSKPYTDEAAHRAWRAWEYSLYMPGMRVEDGENYDAQFLEGRRWCPWAREGLKEARVFAGDQPCRREETRRASTRLSALQNVRN